MKKVDRLPAALRKNVQYDGQVMKSKQLIDMLIDELGYREIAVKKRKSQDSYVLQKGKLKVSFSTIAEKAYIANKFLKLNIAIPGGEYKNQLKKGTEIEMEHKATIEAIKKPGIKTKDAAQMIASDHIAENPNYYNVLETAKLEQGGSIQQLKEGTILEGPSHENGGIEIQVNGKPVAEAEGKEIVINAENSKLFCEELSEINQRNGNGKALDCDTKCDTCEHKLKAGGTLKDSSNNEMELFNKILRDEFGSLFNSIHELNGQMINHPNDRVWVVELNKQATIDSLTPRVENFETRLHINAKGKIEHEIESLTIIPAENNEFYIIIPKNININYYLEDRNELAKGGNLPTGDLYSGANGSKQMKKELSEKFPGIKFSVRYESYSGGDSIRASWNFGPTTDEADIIIDKFQYGKFDGMTDSYTHDKDRTKLVDPSGNIRDFGGVKYTFSDRSTTLNTGKTGNEQWNSETSIQLLIAKDLAKLNGVEWQGHYTQIPNWGGRYRQGLCIPYFT